MKLQLVEHRVTHLFNLTHHRAIVFSHDVPCISALVLVGCGVIEELRVLEGLQLSHVLLELLHELLALLLLICLGWLLSEQ